MRQLMKLFTLPLQFHEPLDMVRDDIRLQIIVVERIKNLRLLIHLPRPLRIGYHAEQQIDFPDLIQQRTHDLVERSQRGERDQNLIAFFRVIDERTYALCMVVNVVMDDGISVSAALQNFRETIVDAVFGFVIQQGRTLHTLAQQSKFCLRLRALLVAICNQNGVLENRMWEPIKSICASI